MKVDFYISSLSSGGAEHVLTNLAANFAEHGEDVSVTSYEKRPQFYSVADGVKLNKVNYNGKGKFLEWIYDFHATCRYLDQRKADVAISFLSRCNFMLILAGLMSRTKVIVCDRNNLLRKYPKYVFQITCFLYRFADTICVQTNEMKSFYPAYLQKKIVVLENPLDFDEMGKQCVGQDIEKENTVISVGRLEKQKDFVTLIKSYKAVAEKHPSWKLKIFGQGNRREELQNLIRKENLEENVKLCGVTHPIVYIFTMDDDMYKFTKTIYWTSMFLLGIKFITWYLYNFKGMTVFSGLLFQYSEGWTRNGFMRMDTGALFGIVLCVTLYYCFVKKQLLYWLVLAFLYIYLIFVTQYRFQLIVTIVLTAYGYYCSTDSNRKKNVKLMAISFIIIAFVLFGGLDYILNLFSLNGMDGGSTAARLLTIDHYWSLIKEKNAILGVGFLSAYTNKAFSILRRSDTDRFWLEDLGILGGIFTFGILSLLLYGKLFFDSMKRTFASHRIRKIEGGDDCLKKCVVVYMILSCILLNIFDAQRMWCMPFYLSVIYFVQNSLKTQKQ